MSTVDAATILNKMGDDAFEGIVSKGVLMMLFPMVRNGTSLKADTTENLLNGYKVGGFSGSGDSVDSEELQDQLMGGENKVFFSGAVDAGDFSITTAFNPEKGRLKLVPIRHSRVVSPQFALLLATTCDEPTKLDVWFIAGVNYLGGREIKGDFGKIIGSSLKFKVSGKPKVGTAECGQIDIALYGLLPQSVKDALGIGGSGESGDG